jgi:uncharacterized low-complexity protein
MGVTTLSAEDMKCGVGKCGSSPAKQKKYMNRDSGKCGAEKKEMYGDKNMMRGDGKCGDSRKGMMRDDDMPNRNMKRQDGKCGGNN